MWPWRRTAAVPLSVVAPRRREWADLPPLQRTIGVHPLVDPPGRFARDLASWQTPAFLAPLGHVVTPSEPSGIVEGIAAARSIETAPSLPVVAEPRPPDGLVARFAAVAQRWGADPPAKDAASVREAEVWDAPEPGPTRTELSEPPAPPATDTPGPPLRLLRAVDPTDASVPPPRPLPQTPALPRAQPAMPPPPQTAPELPAPAPPSVVAPASPHRSAQRAVLGAVTAPRRLGLGTPIVPTSASAATSAEAAQPVEPPRAAARSTSGFLPVQRIGAEPAISPPGAPTQSPPLPPDPGPAEPPTLDDPVTDGVTADAVDPASGGFPAAASSTLGIDTVTIGSPVPRTPALADGPEALNADTATMPVASRSVVGRTGTTATPAARPVVARLLADRPLAPSSLGGYGSEPTAARGDDTIIVDATRSDPPAAPVVPATVALQRFGLPSPDGRLRRPPMPTPPSKPATSSMATPSSIPTPSSMPAPSSMPTTSSMPASPSVPATPARPALPTLPTVAVPPAPPATAGTPAPPVPESGGWTSVDLPDGASPAGRVTAGTQAATGTMPHTASAGDTPPAATASPPPPPGPASAEPEELLKSLFDPLYQRLRAELRKDRDRRGLITDLRR